jgi:hypothetical protein
MVNARGQFKSYRVPNAELCDLVNTMEKMACKRALVHATLGATRTSGIFTQDVEDLPREAFGTAEVIDVKAEDVQKTAAPVRVDKNTFESPQTMTTRMQTGDNADQPIPVDPGPKTAYSPEPQSAPSTPTGATPVRKPQGRLISGAQADRLWRRAFATGQRCGMSDTEVQKMVETIVKKAGLRLVEEITMDEYGTIVDTIDGFDPSQGVA